MYHSLPKIHIIALAIAGAGALTCVAQTTHTVKKHVHKPAKAVHKAAVPADPTIVPLVGTWYVTQDGKESHAQKLNLKKDGTFAFIGSGWKSEGKFKVKDGTLALEWTAVDGSSVKAGAMHKNIPLNAEMNSFVIDKYTYEKHVE